MSLKSDIDRGLEITTQMEKLKAELKQIKERVEAAALKGPHIPLEDPARDGTQYLAQGSDRIVPVVVTADFLTKSFAGGSQRHMAMQILAGKQLGHFYQPKTTFEREQEDGKVFRAMARDILGGETAESFIATCLARDKHGMPINAVKIEWARARAIESEVEA